MLSSSLHALDSCRTACFIIVLTVDRARFVFSIIWKIFGDINGDVIIIQNNCGLYFE